MAVDELSLRRAMNRARVAGAKRRGPPKPLPGDVGLIVEDLRRIKGMAEEVMAEALALDNDDVVAGVGALILHVADVVATAERVKEGGEG